MPYFPADVREVPVKFSFSVYDGCKNKKHQFHRLVNGQNALPVAVFTTILIAPCGRCTFQLFHFSRQCPDILNMLSPVVSMVQYLHAFCPQRQQKRVEKRQKGKSQQFLHQPKLYLNVSYISAPCKAPHPSHPSFLSPPGGLNDWGVLPLPFILQEKVCPSP